MFIVLLGERYKLLTNMGKEEYVCQFCRKVFKRSQNLATHKYRVHSKSKRLKDSKTIFKSDFKSQMDNNDVLKYEEILKELETLEDNFNHTNVTIKSIEESLNSFWECFLKEKQRLTTVVNYINKREQKKSCH